MSQHAESRRSGPDRGTASEIAAWVYCPEQWRLEYGQQLEPENQKALAAGGRHHASNAIAERLAGGSLGIGRVLVAAALVGLLLL
jgi:hypothetical protein